MEKIKIYQVDAFTSNIFEGNPAAVCPLKEWIDEGIMQNIAQENNLSETAFFVRRDNNFEIRWFTPVTELDLAGHPTLASAHVILKELKIIHEKKIISAHRTPKRLYEFADQAYENEINIIIAGAGGSAPKHVQQFSKENHLRWDSLGEFLALAVSLEHYGTTNNNSKAIVLSATLDDDTDMFLDHKKSTSRKVGELDNRGSHFYLALFWAKALASQDKDDELKNEFSNITTIAIQNDLGNDNFIKILKILRLFKKQCLVRPMKDLELLINQGLRTLSINLQ